MCRNRCEKRQKRHGAEQVPPFGEQIHDLASTLRLKNQGGTAAGELREINSSSDCPTD
jgi:hypothetical protein